MLKNVFALHSPNSKGLAWDTLTAARKESRYDHGAGHTYKLVKFTGLSRQNTLVCLQVLLI